LLRGDLDISALGEKIRSGDCSTIPLGRIMSRSFESSKKRRLSRSIKISSDMYERLISLQGFLQLKERRKRSMDELVEFILSFVPDLEIDVDENYYIVQSKPKKTGS
jgi:hypothetical protein